MKATGYGTVNRIGSHIDVFVRQVVSEVRPRWIVPVERKGTALLRAFCEHSEDTNTANWVRDRIVSSEAIPSMSSELVREGTILLIDEGMYHGHSMQKTIDSVTKNWRVERSRIKLAAFSVHEIAARRLQPDFWWFSGLNDDGYRAAREAIISYFQGQGSLLLDTEHIELRVTLECGRREFFEALSRSGTGVAHASPGDRVNLTIHNPFLINEQSLESSLPSGSRIRNVVRKFRVVQRSGREFGIIPIFYPSIPVTTTSDEMKRLPECLSRLAGSPQLNFHLVGTYSALHLLQTATQCLRELVARQKVVVTNPDPKLNENSLGHLKCLFPSLDLDKLHSALYELIERGRGQKLRSGNLGRAEYVEVMPGSSWDHQLRKFRWAVLRAVVRLMEDCTETFDGATLNSLLESGGESLKAPDDISRGLYSAALDQLIDNAVLLPVVKMTKDQDGVCLLERAFRVDGEVVASDVRRAFVTWRDTTPPRV